MVAHASDGSIAIASLARRERDRQAAWVERFSPATRTWFRNTFAGPTPVQARGWKAIAEGQHALLIAPTGSGKTLAAFLWSIDRLMQSPTDPEHPGVRVLYVSPLKALVYDVQRNLRAPLVGVSQAAMVGQEVRVPTVAMRTGDTPSRVRQQMLRHPPDILVTTPESLYLMLTSQARSILTTVNTVIVDEVHAIAPTKRGAHLAVSLERLAWNCDGDPQRIGLSATATPLAEVARFLGGDREVSIVDTSEPPHLDLSVIVPVPDMTQPSLGRVLQSNTGMREEETEGETVHEPVVKAYPGMGEATDNSIWPAIYPRILDLIASHKTTIVFVNSRGLCERLAQRLREESGDPDLVRAHHGSVAHDQREQIEDQLKRGAIRAIVATSSLELGIDMGAVDLVILVASPGAVARGLQRVGRAGHGVGEVSEGKVFPKHRGDLLECAVVGQRMRAGTIEPLQMPRNPLDVLAQHIVSMCAEDSWSVGDLTALIRRTANYRELPQDALIGVIDMLSGRYPSHAFGDLRPRITWNRDEDVLEARRGAKQVAIFNGGTIPDRGSYGVYLGEEGGRIGELDEEMVHESAPGQNIMLGASTWRIEQITRDRVIVRPAPGEPGRLPFWHGEGPGRPVELGRALGAFTRELAGMSEPQGLAWLQSDYDLDAFAAQNLLAYVGEQKAHTGTLPTDRTITIERFRDELGDWRICILSVFGARVNAPWALVMQAQLESHYGFEVQVLWSDDGIVLRLVEVDELPEIDLLLPDPEDVEARLVEQIANSALFAGQFRENAARSLLLPRSRANARTPLWQQRLKAQQLLAVAREYPSFPIIIETYRSCLQDIFDVPALVALLGAIRRRDVRIDEVETSGPSPFSRSLVFAYVAAYMYEGDAPLAERKAQALALDRKLLRELLGKEELRELLDDAVMDELESELQFQAEGYRATHIDGVHDVLRRVGDLDAKELELRCEPHSSAQAWLETLLQTRRVLEVRMGGEQRLIAVEDAGLARDALGCALAVGVPTAFLDPVTEALPMWIRRWARTHGPFRASQIAHRYGLGEARVQEVLALLEARGVVVAGAFRTEGSDRQWCDADVLRRIKRRTLARLRGEIAPVDARTLGRFLPAWHGIGDEDGSGLPRLEEAIAQLEGVPLSFAELEQVILPARVRGFRPAMLDEMGAMGMLVWVGHGALGKHDGRVALYRRDRVGVLIDPPHEENDAMEPLDALHRALLDTLEQRGACFFAELQHASGEQGTIKEVREALWDLAWRGLVTNDTFAILRHQSVALRARRGTRAPSMQASLGGRWSLVRGMMRDVTPTERAHAKAVTLLERHGVLAREVASLEPLEGGYTAIYRILREMEDTGKVRRGHFVEGLSGAQFATPGAVDRLRACRSVAGEASLVVLSAVDPANPFGWLLPWPVEGDQKPPRRVAGATVVLLGGELVLYLERSGRHLITFGEMDVDILERAVGALKSVAARKRGRMLRVELINGQASRTAPQAEILRNAGFTSDPGGLILEG